MWGPLPKIVKVKSDKFLGTDKNGYKWQIFRTDGVYLLVQLISDMGELLPTKINKYSLYFIRNDTFDFYHEIFYNVILWINKEIGIK